MKKLISILLFLPPFIINAQSFGPDKIVYNNPNVEVRELFLQKSFNGWIYVGFNYYEMPFRGYRVDYSRDNGNSWQTLIDFSVPGASGWYPQIFDMLVAGTDTTNLNIFLALLGNGNGGPTNFGAVRGYHGTTGIQFGPNIEIGDFTTYRVNGIALSSDDNHPMSLSTPYSVAVIYSAGDSLNLFYSDDGGISYNRSSLLSGSLQDYEDIDIAYGSYQNPALGKFGITYVIGANIGVMVSDPGVPTVFSNNIILDTIDAYTNGRCVKPKISIQSSEYGNSNADYTSVVLASITDSVDSTTDVISFYLSDTQNGGIWNFEIIDSALSIKETPVITFNEIDSTFLVTYFDTSANELPLLKHTIEFPGTWARTSYDYPDTLEFLEPIPQLDATGGLSCIWKQKEDSTTSSFVPETIKYDELTLGVRVNEIHVSQNTFNLFPNPSIAGANIYLDNNSNNVRISVVNSIGEVVFIDESPEIENGVYLLPGFSRGIYQVRIVCDTWDDVRQLIQLH